MLFTAVVQTPVEEFALVDALQLTVGALVDALQLTVSANGILPSCHQHARILIFRPGSRADSSGTHSSRTRLYRYVVCSRRWLVTGVVQQTYKTAGRTC
jgi:hypothetical protein